MPHPLLDLLGLAAPAGPAWRAWCESQGLDADHLARCVRGEVEISRARAEWLLLWYAIPADAWSELEPPLPEVRTARIAQAKRSMDQIRSESAPARRRVGRPSHVSTPLARWLSENRWTQAKLHGELRRRGLGISAAAVASWSTGRLHPQPAARTILVEITGLEATDL